LNLDNNRWIAWLAELKFFTGIFIYLLPRRRRRPSTSATPLGGLRYLELDVNDLIKKGASRKKAIHYLYKKTFTSRQGLSKRKTIVVWIKNKLRISLS